MATGTGTKGVKVRKVKPAEVRAEETPAADPGPRVRQRIALGALRRHADNRVPTEVAIFEVAASMQSLGQLEATLVRPLFGDTFEIISGETRFRAAQQLGWSTLDCEVRSMTDSEALRAMAAANAARQDLSPIDKAKLIVRLCEPKASGGGGLTREAAAAMFDLQSGGAASNLVRLLELPEVWQQRVASEAIPQTFARELVRLVGLDEQVWTVVEEEWEKFCDADEGDAGFGPFASRADLAFNVDRLIDEWTRVVTPGETQAPAAWRDAAGWMQHPIRFNLTPELEQELRIAEFVIDGNRERRATNVKLYDAYQIPALKALRTKAAASAERPIDEADDGDTEERSAVDKSADDEQRRQDAADKLARRIDAWRLDWLRDLCADRIVEPQHAELAVRICMWLQSHVETVPYTTRNDLSLASFLANLWVARGDTWTMCLRTKAETGAAELVAHWLRVPARDGHTHPFASGYITELAQHLKIDLAHAWCTLQSSGKPTERFSAFFELHSSEQLDELGRELGIHVADAKTKTIKIQRLTGCERVFKLPRALFVKTSKTKGGK